KRKKVPTPFLDLKADIKTSLDILVDAGHLNCSDCLTMTTGKKFIGYLRVSTKAQGQSGLGLDAQKKSLQDYVKGAKGTLAATYTETESGKRDNRPELMAALA